MFKFNSATIPLMSITCRSVQRFLSDRGFVSTLAHPLNLDNYIGPEVRHIGFEGSASQPGLDNF